MKSATRMTIVLSIFLTALLPVLSAGAAEQVIGKTFYTTANIWYEKQNEIDSTNYHKGTILPIGTKVKVTEVYDGTTPLERNPFGAPFGSGSVQSQVWDHFIRFEDGSGKSYKLIFRLQHAERGMTVWDLFKQYFTENDPMAEEGSFKVLTPDEQRHVMAGEIAAGMSRTAVVMAYGYPPTHKTPSLTLDRWIYWEGRRKTKTVLFSDGKVVENEALQGNKKLSPIENCIKACKENTSRTPEQCFDACNR